MVGSLSVLPHITGKNVQATVIDSALRTVSLNSQQWYYLASPVNTTLRYFALKLKACQVLLVTLVNI